MLEGIDHYEVLQISPNAEMDTIHRVYRMMATRFHPDNPKTGDIERFIRLRRAYQVLSDPVQRAQYDGARGMQDRGPLPIFELKDFALGIEGENNRRLGILSILYNRRRTQEDHSGLSVLDLECRMGFPREHLSFALWYLRSKRFVSLEDNSNYVITAEGADYVETNSNTNTVIRELIGGGSARTQSASFEQEPLLT